MTILCWKVCSYKKSKQFWRRFLFLSFLFLNLNSISYLFTNDRNSGVQLNLPYANQVNTSARITVGFRLNGDKQCCHKHIILFYLYLDIRCWGKCGALVVISPFCCFCCENYIRKWLLFLLCLLGYGMWDDSQRRRNCGRAGPIKRLGSYLVLTKYGFLTLRIQPVAFASIVRANLPLVS